MPLGRSGHDLRRWHKLATGKGRPFDIGAAVQPRATASHRRIPGGVSRYDKFLLAGLLLVVAGWIVFRLLLLTLD